MAENFSVFKVISLIIVNFSGQKNVAIRANISDIVDSVIVRYEKQSYTSCSIYACKVGGWEVPWELWRVAGVDHDWGEQDDDWCQLWRESQGKTSVVRVDTACQDRTYAEAESFRGGDEEYQENTRELKIEIDLCGYLIDYMIRSCSISWLMLELFYFLINA